MPQCFMVARQTWRNFGSGWCLSSAISEVLTYLNQGISVFEDIRDLLGRQFDRLPDNEQRAMFWQAIHRQPVSIAEIHENVVDQVYQQSVPNLINSLIRRSLLEKTDGLFSCNQL
ncbi:MAG: hypothetical protein V7K40_16100 [Nostoc sp.]|uniref:hypothetical protein n=1 Tax=Nostoc sp. TaxID=1180 RepID=UPI002FFB3C01